MRPLYIQYLNRRKSNNGSGEHTFIGRYQFPLVPGLMTDLSPSELALVVALDKGTGLEIMVQTTVLQTKLANTVRQYENDPLALASIARRIRQERDAHILPAADHTLVDSIQKGIDAGLFTDKAVLGVMKELCRAILDWAKVRSSILARIQEHNASLGMT